MTIPTDRDTKRTMKIGVVMPIVEDQELGQPPSYTTIRDLALQAEQSGFDSVWVFDHLLFRDPEKETVGIWEAWTILSALAAATSQVELGTLVMCTAFRNPALLAKMASTVEEVSNGRLILGLGAGWHQPEFDAFGFPFDHKVDRFEEALKIIGPLLREGYVDFNGTYYSAPNCELRPRGPRLGGPPILIGAFKPRMLQLTARHADSWNTCWLGHAPALAEPRAKLEAACAAEGRDPTTLDVTVGVSIKYPDGSEPDEPASNPDKVITGTAQDVANAFQEYAQLDVAHLICSLSPCHTKSVEWLAEALNLYRSAQTMEA